jgi:DNA-binding Lrp family transcriptional regulator
MIESELDQTDRALVAALTADGRASVTTLAARLGLARGTVKSRLAKLQSSGAIRRFTVELSAEASPDLVRAVMLIELQGPLARKVTASLRRITAITDLHSTNGAWDLVAQIEVSSLPEFDRVLREVREINGVLNSETCLLLDQA